MTDLEINSFIETMDEYGDTDWTPSSVKDSKFANMTLENAISTRLNECSWLNDIIAKASGLL